MSESSRKDNFSSYNSRMPTKVTVFSVVGPNLASMGGYDVPGGASYLRVSLKLLSELNPDIFFNVRLSHWCGHGKLDDFPHFGNMHVTSHIYNEKDIPGFGLIGSVEQHGTLLNKVLSENKSDDHYTIILDPDFFVFRAGTVSEIISRMESRELDAIGVSYPARYPIEYSWKFPQVYFMLSDNRKLDLSSINFKSGLESDEHAQEVQQLNSFITRILQKLTSIHFLQRRFHKTLMLLNQLLSVKSNRVLINPRDTGWRLGEYLEEKSYEILPNVFKAPEGKIPLFKPSVFEAENTDQNLSSISPQTNFLLRGILNGSKYEKQNFLFRYLFHPILKAKIDVEPTKWPNDSVIDSSWIFEDSIYKRLRVKLDGADFYAFNQIPFGVHLGHKGKANLKNGIGELAKDLLDNLD